MGQRNLVKSSNNQIQSKRRAIQIRREKEHALAQYKKIARKASKKRVLPSKEPVSVNHAIFFTVCLGVASVVMPQLAGLALIFSILVVGQVLGAKFDLFEKREDKGPELNSVEDERLVRMVRPDVVKLSHKKKANVPVHKAAPGVCFKGEDGATITQFDWRQLSN